MNCKILSTVCWALTLTGAAIASGSAGAVGPVATASAKFPCAGHHAMAPDLEPSLSLQLEESSSRSPGKAFVLSLLLPGLGEWYAGSPTKGKIFLVAEAAVWSSFAAFEQYSSWKKKDYQLYAVSHAGVNPEGKDDDFYKQIGLYQDIWSYNEEQLHIRDMDAVYWDEAQYFWEWDNTQSQARYSTLRESSRKAHRRALNMVGAAVLNRIVSAIDALRTAKAFNQKKALEEATGFDFDVRLKGSLKNPKAMVVLKKTF